MTRSLDSPFAKVRSTRAHEHIVEQLQQLILSGKLASGTRLPSERAMMTEFQVSRPTIREALRVAENMGLIEVRPGDPGGSKVLGAPSIGIVRVFDSLLQTGCMSTLELVEMRIMLDSSAAALASTQPKSRLTKVIEALGDMQTTTDLRTFAQQDTNFHEAVILASGNRLFHLVFQALNDSIRSLIENRFMSSPQWGREETLQQHTAIANAIQKGEAHRAARAVRTHLGEFYLPVLSAQDKNRMTAFLQAMEK
jgi:GntR family transcriptional regulator, transcriptional repressor for pyruvate dehydrogenase complex